MSRDALEEPLEVHGVHAALLALEDGEEDVEREREISKRHHVRATTSASASCPSRGSGRRPRARTSPRRSWENRQADASPTPRAPASGLPKRAPPRRRG